MNLVLPLALVLSLFPAVEKQPAAADIQNQESKQVMVTYKSNEEDVKTVDVPTGESTGDFVQKLQDRPNVANVEPDNFMHLSDTVNDPQYSEQWYQHVIGTDNAWNVTTGSNDMIVAVIDDGIDLNHRDLKNQIISPYDAILNSTSEIPVGEHGTHVSGIIASKMNNAFGGTGIAPHVKIMPVNVFNGEEALYSDVISGIDYAIDHHADIINLSLGGTEQSEMLNDAIQRAYKAGIIIVAAAGNESTNAFDYPAAYDHVIGVSATDAFDRFASDFSNYGSDIDLAAPGTDIFSTLPNNRFGYMTGTSMATPIVAGVAALVWSANPSFTNTQIEEQLFNTADDLGPQGKDIYYGYGRINASKAVAIVSAVNQKEWSLSVNEISDSDTLVTGTLSDIVPNGKITIYTEEKILATSKIENQDKFTIEIPKQLANTKIYIKVDHPTIYPVMKIVVDKTTPSEPVVPLIGDNSNLVTGTAEVDATVIVQSGSQQLGVARVDSSGEFQVIMIKKQKAGTVLTVSAIDAAGNVSSAKKVRVLDKTAPAKPVVDKVSSKTTRITGKAEAYSTVYLQKDSKIIGSAKANAKGKFSIKIIRKNANKTLYIYTIDIAKNVSKRVTVTF